MEGHRIEHISAAISYIETHLNEKLTLDAVARGVSYSKYHLHRMFTDIAGMTPHDYIQRRQLTEAAKLLVFSDKPLLELALTAGYESQQAFTSVFKAMYKKTPMEYRRQGAFYPLQLEFVLYPAPSLPGSVPREISYAAPDDLSDWMELVSLVVGGFPNLEENSHRERVMQYIRQGRAIILRDGPAIIGAAAFSHQTGRIDFLAVHPQYRRYGIDKALLNFMIGKLPAGREISITTFREGDRADTGQREEYERLGFAEAEYLTEFGYPTQKLILTPPAGGERQ